MSLKLASRISRNEWDAFIVTVEHSHYEQSSPWAEVKANYGWSSERLVLRNSAGIQAGAEVLLRKLPVVGNIGYVPSGPVLKRKDETSQTEICRALREFARDKSLAYLVVSPALPGPDLDSALQAAGFSEKPQNLPPSGLISATTTLNLERGLDDLLSEMRASTRRNIRRSSRSKLTFREGGKADLPVFKKLFLEHCRRLGTTPSPPQEDFFDKTWEAFAPKGWVRLFLVENGDRPVVGGLGFSFGKIFRFWKVGWTGAEKKSYPNEFIEWNTIRWAKDYGFKLFDLVWVPLESAVKMVRGEELRQETDGIAIYKLGFGGDLLISSGPRCLFGPVLRKIFEHGGDQLLGFPYALTGVHGVWNSFLGRR